MKNIPQFLRLVMISSLCTFISATSALAQAQKGYHLFNPVPRENMREFSIDRPDVTESPISVDAGHFQFESDLVKWTKSTRDARTNTMTLMSGLYKMGITHSWDVHIGIELYNFALRNGETSDGGYGTTTVRVKHNFWGNDGETATAFGIIPYVSFPSSSKLGTDITYGAGFPFSYGLTDNLDLGGQAQFDFIPSKGGRSLSFFQTVVLGGRLVGNLDFYVEGLAIFPDGQSQCLMNGGLIYNFSPNLKVDLATNQGLSTEAPMRVYLGISFRI